MSECLNSKKKRLQTCQNCFFFFKWEKLGSLWEWTRVQIVQQAMQQCKYCQIHIFSYPKEPLMPSEVYVHPFQMVAADYFEVKSHHYLVYVDCSSGWNRTAYFLPGKSTSADLIKVLREEFAGNGSAWGVELWQRNKPHLLWNQGVVQGRGSETLSLQCTLSTVKWECRVCSEGR